MRSRATRTVILPIGAIEQHGPNLPIDTDAYLAVELAVAGAQDRPAVVAPPIIYGCRSRPQSGGGELFPGTLSLDGITFIQLVSDVLGGLLRHGFRKLLVFSWHMENRGFVYEAASVASSGTTRREARGHGGALRLAVRQPRWTSSFPDGFPGWPLEHAGVLETSLLLFLRPAVVGEHAMRATGWMSRPYDVLPERDQRQSKPASCGMHPDASAESGELAFGEIVAKLQCSPRPRVRRRRLTSRSFPVLDAATSPGLIAQLDVAAALRDAFAGLASGRSHQPPQTLVEFGDGADAIIYPAAVEDFGVVAVKLSPYLPARTPPVTAWTLLVSTETGEPVLLCDSAALTAERTAGYDRACRRLPRPRGRIATRSDRLRAARSRTSPTRACRCEASTRYASSRRAHPAATKRPRARMSADCCRSVDFVVNSGGAVADADVVLLCTSSGTRS